MNDIRYLCICSGVKAESVYRRTRKCRPQRPRPRRAPRGARGAPARAARAARCAAAAPASAGARALRARSARAPRTMWGSVTTRRWVLLTLLINETTDHIDCISLGNDIRSKRFACI